MSNADADTDTAEAAPDPRWIEAGRAYRAMQNAGLDPRSPFNDLRDAIYIALLAEKGWAENTWATADRLAVEIWEEPAPEAAPALTEAWARSTIAAHGLTPHSGVNALKGALLAALNDDDNLDDHTSLMADDLAWLIHEPQPPDDGVYTDDDGDDGDGYYVGPDYEEF